jgi:hypothetical protein
VTNPVYSAPLDLVDTAVLDLLRSAGPPVFDGAYQRVPELQGADPRYAANPLKPPYPYAILYAIPGGSSDPFPDLDGDPREATLAYQVTTVSNLRNQCRATARLLRDRLLARTGSGFVYGLNLPAGWRDIGRRPDPAMPGIDPSGEPPAAIYSLPQRLYLTIAPA